MTISTIIEYLKKDYLSNYSIVNESLVKELLDQFPYGEILESSGDLMLVKGSYLDNSIFLVVLDKMLEKCLIDNDISTMVSILSNRSLLSTLDVNYSCNFTKNSLRQDKRDVFGIVSKYIYIKQIYKCFLDLLKYVSDSSSRELERNYSVIEAESRGQDTSSMYLRYSLISPLDMDSVYSFRAALIHLREILGERNKFSSEDEYLSFYLFNYLYYCVSVLIFDSKGNIRETEKNLFYLTDILNLLTK